MSVPVLALRPAIDSRPPALPWSAAPAGPSVPDDQPTLSLVQDTDEELGRAPVPARSPITVDVAPAGLAPEREPALVDQVATWAAWFAQLLVEAVEGRRPLESLGRWLDAWVLAEVSRRIRLQRRVRSPGAGTAAPPVVVSLRAQLTHPRVLEVSVHLRRGRRSAAWAFQLVRAGERWRCVALALDPLPRADGTA